MRPRHEWATPAVYVVGEHAAMKFSQKEEAWKMLGGCIGTRGAVAVG
jgi:hypothetical protein